MRYLIGTSLALVLLVGLTLAQAQRYWSRSIMNDRVSTGHPHEVELGEVYQRDILIGGLDVKNQLPESNGRGSVMIIEGHQKSDGTFWPTAELQVQKEQNSEWVKIGSSGTERPSGQALVHNGMSVSGLQVNLEPFKGYLGKFRFGRILLKSGDEAVFLLDDLRPPTSEKNK